MRGELFLFPAPRELHRRDGVCKADPAGAATRLDAQLPAQSYLLEIAREGISITHADQSGLRHARDTLRQIAEQSEAGLPELLIRDAPDFAVRGYMLDISRDRVPTLATLERIVELLARLRINHFELYTEHTFAYREHEAVWRDASPITADDVRWLDALCRAHGIELSANQNSFGHMGRWLEHDAYRHLAETPDGWETRSGTRRPPGCLAPDDVSLGFVLGLWRELLPAFSSRRVNVNCDETFELGRGRSAARVKTEGRGRVYLDFLLGLLAGLHDEGCEVLFWGDVLRSHPELAGQLPKNDTTALVWHYEAPADASQLGPDLLERLAEFGASAEMLRGFAPQVAPFAAAGVPFWVCPGTSGWNSLLGRWPNARANLLDAAAVGRERGAQGYLITDWGDGGHLQPPSVSFLPLAYGAALAWGLDANREVDLARFLDREVFADADASLGSLLEKIGGLYAGTGLLAANASPLFTSLVGEGILPAWGDPSAERVSGVLGALEDAERALAASRPRCADADTVRRELGQACRLARHGAWRIARGAGLPSPGTADLARDLAEAIEEQHACWLLRSRPGGLDDSLAGLRRTLAGYGR